MRTFLDSSAFTKRLIEEPGSDAVAEICAQADQLGVSILCAPEIASALNRRVREGVLTRSQYRAVIRRLWADLADADVVNLTPAVVHRGIDLLETHLLGSLDALQMACAQEWGTDLFVSADRRQLAAAGKAGLDIREV
jgi:predicted nucleic acid-binding protein